jgi:hypothetical protein
MLNPKGRTSLINENPSKINKEQPDILFFFYKHKTTMTTAISQTTAFHTKI